MPYDENNITYHDGCEMCGGTGKTPYTENLGFYCDDCAEEHGGGHKGKWRPWQESDNKTSEEIIEVLNKINFDEYDQYEKPKNQIAKDLNVLLGRTIYELEASGDESDIDLAVSVSRIVQRVAEFEEIKTV